MTVSKTTTKTNPVSISGQQTTPWPRIWAARGPIGSNIAFFNAESAARWIADRTQPELYLTTEYVPDSLTAELQKENARLEKLLEWAAKVLLQHMNDEDYEASLAGIYATLTESALNPPKGGAAQKGLSKEKAK